MSVPHRCWAEVDLNALRQNLLWLRHAAGPDTRIMTVVKADAYGHGLKQIAALLMQSGADAFGVANLTEARAIRSVGKGWPILMLGACLPDEIDLAVRDNVMATVSSLAEAEAFSYAAAKRRKPAKVQLKIDTGMGRIGAAPDNAVELAERIRQLPYIELVGLWTHYRSVEDDSKTTAAQRNAFKGVLTGMNRAGIKFDYIHSGNSGALLWERDKVSNTIRPGLLVYGVIPPSSRPTPQTLKSNLAPAMTLKTRVSFVKSAPKGTPLSYGGTFVTPRRMKIATLSAGYGDGLPRNASDGAKVLIHGTRCRIVGRITMDQSLVDVSRLAGVASGDEAVLFGSQGAKVLAVEEVARWCDTIPWEILTRVTERAPRIYLGGHAA